MKKNLSINLLLFATTISAYSLNGVNVNNIDKNVRPQDDFYQYACGGWQKLNPLKQEYSRYGTFDDLGEMNKQRVKDLVVELSSKKSPYGSVAQKVGDLYNMGMDSIKLNEDGVSPILDDIKEIKNLSKSNLISYIAKAHCTTGNPFFGLYVEADMMDCNMNIAHISQSGISLGDRDYYLLDDEATKNIRAEYIKYLKSMFILVGYSDSEATEATYNVLDIETQLAKSFYSREELRNPAANYKIYSVSELKSSFKNIDWDTYFKEMGLNGTSKLDVCQPKALDTANNIIESADEKALKNYLIAQYIGAASDYLGDDFRKVSFNFYGKVMSGKQVDEPRWKRALSVPNSVLSEALGKEFVKKYFPAESKEKALELVKNLQIALGQHISDLKWMSDETKNKAKEKLNAFHIKIGYPDKWRDYSDLAIDSSKSYWENIKNANAFENKYNLSFVGKPVDKDKWFMSPQTVNAYYNPTTNEICFPAAILQYPFFDAKSDDACNYGAIGVVIGHEMTHGFDDQGRQFDKDGNFREWWTAEDADKFTKLANVLVNQFNDIEVLPGEHANGTFTLGENIADHGGLRLAYTAYHNSLKGKKSMNIDGFTPDQRFFLAYANVWAANIRNEEIRRRTKIDPHSLGKWRVNASLKNIQPFYEAFKIKKGDAMYMAPENRVTIW